jgi:hypothetical protein
MRRTCVCLLVNAANRTTLVNAAYLCLLTFVYLHCVLPLSYTAGLHVLLCNTLYLRVLLWNTLYLRVLLCNTLYLRVLLCNTLYLRVLLCNTLYLRLPTYVYLHSIPMFAYRPKLRT